MAETGNKIEKTALLFSKMNICAIIAKVARILP